MKTGYNYSIMERYEKTTGIPYTDIKIKGRYIFAVFLISIIIIDVILYLLISFLLNSLVAIIVVVLLSISAIIVLIYVTDIDKHTKLPKYLLFYYENIKSYSSIFVNGEVFFMGGKEKLVERVIFEKVGKKII